MLARLAVPLLCGAILVGAGLFQVLLPVSAGERPCGGGAIAVVARADRPGHHAEECRKVATTMLLFGTGAGAAGIVMAAAAGAAALRRPTIRR